MGGGAENGVRWEFPLLVTECIASVDERGVLVFD